MRLLALAACCATAIGADIPAVSLGDGPATVVEFTLDQVPLRRLTGLQRASDVAPLADGGLLLVDPPGREVIRLDADWNVRWRAQVGPAPQRARPLPDGGLLVCSGNDLITLDASGAETRRFSIPGLVAAAPAPDGRVAVAWRAEGENGRIGMLNPDGSWCWQSRPDVARDAAGRRYEVDTRWALRSVASLDVLPDGNIFTADFDRATLRLFSPDGLPLLEWKAADPHPTDTRVGPFGELLSAYPTSMQVQLEFAPNDGRLLVFELPPYCAQLSPRGTLLVGFGHLKENELLNATLRRAPPPAVVWWRRGLPLPALGAALALALALLVRRRWGGTAPPQPVDPLPPPPAAAPPRLPQWARVPLAVTAAGVACTGGLVAWRALNAINELVPLERLPTALLGMLAGGVALRLLNLVCGSTGSLSALTYAAARPRDPRPPRYAYRLAAPALLAVFAATALLELAPREQAAAIALWLAAQIFLIVALARPPVSVSWRRHAPLGVILLLAAVLRFGALGSYPDSYFDDHYTLAFRALDNAAGEWNPFFTLANNNSCARPWLTFVYSSLLVVFGIHDWVVRIPAAFFGVLTVWGGYLLGAALFHRRVGLIAAALLATHHSLLLYHRQPYVTENVPLFLFCLYFVARALRTGSWRSWAAAGFFAGWAMLSYRGSTVFPFIGAAWLLYFALRHPRWLLRRAPGMGWLVVGALVVYLPMLPFSLRDQALEKRLHEFSPLIDINGRLAGDAALWRSQLERSFGTVLYRPDQNVYINTRLPICLPPEGALFGIGLVYLLLGWATPVPCLIVAAIVIPLLLGGTLLMEPQFFYHFLIAYIPILLAAAVAVDRLLAPLDQVRARWPRQVALVVVVVLLAWMGQGNLAAAWRCVARPPARPDGQVVYNCTVWPMAGRIVCAAPEQRFYVVRGKKDLSAAHLPFRFYAWNSDISDIDRPLRDALPVPPTDAPAVTFLVLASRAGERELLLNFYPGGQARELFYAVPPESLWAYTVPRETIRRAYRP